MPGDLETLLRSGGALDTLFRSSPFIFVAFVKGKDGPWRLALQKVCLRSGVPTCRREMFATLVKVAREMQGVNTAAWSANVGRRVSHHSGWKAFLGHRGVVKVISSRRKTMFRCSGEYLRWGRTCYGVQKPTAMSLNKMSDLQRLGFRLLDARPPRTLEDWCDTIVREAGGRKQKKYSWLGLWRAVLIRAMRLAGINRLSWDKTATIKRLCDAFPDRKQHVLELAPSPLIADLVSSLGYDGPIELLTMHLCLFGSSEMERFSPEWLRANRDKLIRAREQYRKTHGLQPRCAVLCAGLV